MTSIIQTTVETTPAGTHRLDNLDSIRGLAAIIVVLNHCYDVLPDPLAETLAWLNFSPLRIIALGKPAVVLFFVLSGFVLSLSLMDKRHLSYSNFLVRRMFRIYVPFATSILLSAALYVLIQPQQIAGMNTYFLEEIWTRDPTFNVVMAHLLMVNRPQDITLNNPMWSLVTEMRVSLLFPPLFALTQVKNHAAIVIAVAFCVPAWLINYRFAWVGFPYTNHDAVEAVLLVFYFAPCFVCGIILARYRTTVRALFSEMPTWTRAFLWIFAWAAMSQNFDLLNAVGAMLIIGLSLHSPRASAFLSLPSLRWLGSVSYSLYLVHILVIASLMQTLTGRISLPLILAVAIILSLAAAQVMYVTIEAPAMKLGRRLTRQKGLTAHAV